MAVLRTRVVFSLAFAVLAGACGADSDESSETDPATSSGTSPSTALPEESTGASGIDSSGTTSVGASSSGDPDSGSSGDPEFTCGAETNSAWGIGDDAGLIKSDVWTPGRDDEGRINCASWETVPTQRWVQVVGTRLDALDADVKAAIPGWTDRGTEDWNGVLADWVGMAWDTRQGTERGWVTVGGGHDGSSNDGVYRLDLRSMTWSIERMPSDSSAWPASYNSSFTNFPPAVAYYGSDAANPERVYRDEFFDPANRSISSRTPTSRHTYGSTVFVPELGDAGMILMGCRRYWEYDVGSATWSLPAFPFDTMAGYDGASGYTGENMHGWWNASEARYYVSATQNYNASETWSVQVGGTDWRWEGGYPTGGWFTVSTAQDQRDQTLHTLMYDAGRPDIMRITDLDTREIANHPIELAESLAGLTFDPMAYWDGGTVAHIAETGQYLANMHSVREGMIWVLIDETTWVAERADFEGSYPMHVDIHTETKLEYFPEMHAVVWVNTADEDIRIIRF
ncbi:MAG: hypothetical protein JKY37_31820 [Nannocystaceae bacterium]|nr:hypothetical protein [Nannocystaceae bacterium]